MKTEILISIDALRVQVVSLLPEDVIPPPDVPTGLNIISVSEDSSPVILLGWNNVPEGCIAILEQAGAEGDPYGEGSWTPQGIYLTRDAMTGAWATYVMEVPANRHILFRLSAQRIADGVTSAPCDPIQYDSPS